MQKLVHGAVALLLLVLPIQCLDLPMAMSLVDLVGVLLLPFVWSWMLWTGRPVRLPYLVAMLAILGTSGVACLFSYDPGQSFGVLLKEAYLYVWMVTLAAVFENASDRELRGMLAVWVAAACASGALVLAQFLHPPLQVSMNEMLAGRGMLDPYRPSGLMANSNSTGVYQLVAFVPLVYLRLPRLQMILLGALLMLMMLGTGSMASALGFGCALVASLVGLVVLFKDWRMVTQFTIGATLTAALVVVVFLVLLQMLPEMQHRLQYVLTGRSEGSAEGRFLIWDRAATMLVAQAKLWGVGPDMFVVMDGHELHNDLLSFAVERGPLALLSLLLFGALACWRCVQTVRDGRALGARESVVFLAAVIGIAVESQTHELFHQRPVWLLLAFLEAVHWRQQAMLRSRAEPQLAALSAPMAAVRA